MRFAPALLGVLTMAALVARVRPATADWLEAASFPSAPGDLLADGTTAAQITADSVAVFSLDGFAWVSQATIHPPFPGLYGALGQERMLIAGPNSGAELVALHREPAGWVEEPSPSLTAAPIRGLAIDGDYAVVGAPGDDASGLPNGAVYVLERAGQTWVPMQTLLPTSSQGNDGFGYGVAVFGARLAVCAESEYTKLAGGGGAVHIFDLVDGVWAESNALIDPSNCGSFCRQVGLLDEKTLVVSDGCILHTFNFDGHLWHEDLGYVAALGALADFTLGAGRVMIAEPAASRVRVLKRSGKAWVEESIVQQTDQVGLNVGHTPGWVISAGHDDKLRFFGELGAVCDDGGQCPLGRCADGRCCDSLCANSCEACSPAGHCELVVGDPRPGHPVCAASCDGVTTSQAGTCDGAQPGCVPQEIDCAAYRCEDGRCRDACASRDDCAPGHACIEGACVPGKQACLDPHTAQLADGSYAECAPYRCTDIGVCGAHCDTTAHCSDGFVCTSSGTCVATTSEDGGDGCNCQWVGAQRPPLRGLWPLALALFSAVGRSTRRRTRGGVGVDR